MPSFTRMLHLLPTCMVTLGWLVLSASPAPGAILLVSSTADSGPDTLRDAIMAANSTDTILISPTLSGQTVTFESEIVITNKSLTITAHLLSEALNLSGDAGVAGDRTDNVRLFSLQGTAEINFFNLIFRDGESSFSGGAIVSEPDIQLQCVDCSFLDNHATTRGGAILGYNLALTRVLFQGNSADQGGGALRSGGTSFVTNCIFTACTSGTAAGAIQQQNRSTANLTIVQSLFSRNQAATVGGAIFVDDTSTVTIINTTLAENRSGGNGSAVAADPVSNLNLINATLSANHAGGAGALGMLGTPRIHVENTLIAGNTADGSNSTLQGRITTVAGRNFIGSPGGLIGIGTLGQDYLTGEPRLLPLRDYGAPTPTMPPQFNSPVIDAATATGLSPTNDQRGQMRPLDGDNDGAAGMDIGAIELNTLAVTTVADEDNGGLGLGIGDSLRECVAEAGRRVGFDAISFDSSLQNMTTFLAGTELHITNSLSIDASALTNRAVLSGQDLSRVIRVSGDPTVLLHSLEIRDGRETGTGGGMSINSAHVVITDCAIIANESLTMGGGIANSGALAMTNSLIANNVAGTTGGGLANLGRLSSSVSQSIIEDNHAREGAGVANTGIFMVEGSTLARNRALEHGGGAWNQISSLGTGVTLTLLNCTVARNVAGGHGGGVYNYSDDGDVSAVVRLWHTTVVENAASGNANGPRGPGIVGGCGQLSGQFGSSGGGVFNGCDGRVSARAAIIARNQGIGFRTQYAGELVNYSGSAFGGSQRGIWPDGDPQLAPFGDYGGPFETAPPLSGSIVVDVFQSFPSNQVIPTLDQNGISRFLDGDGDTVGEADYGAVEFDPAHFLVSPPDQAQGVSATVFLAWNFQPFAQSHEVFLGTDANSLVSAGTTSVGGLPLPGALQPVTTYYWRVDSDTGTGIVSSATFQFTTRDHLLVTTAADELDGLGNGTGDSLREILAHADDLPGPDIIQFHPSLSGETIQLSIEDGSGQNLGAALQVASSVTIDASPLPDPIRLTGSSTVQGSVLMSEPGVAMTLLSLDITGGTASGIRSQGPATLIDCDVFGNSTPDAVREPLHGGGIYCGHALNLIRCSVRDNRTGDGVDFGLGNGVGAHAPHGGGIYGLGPISISTSTISGNATGDGGDADELISGQSGNGGHGGGIYARDDLHLTDSVVFGNRAGDSGHPQNRAVSGERGRGGGIWLGRGAAMTNCTIDANTVMGTNGGGIFRGTSTTNVAMEHCTLTANFGGPYAVNNTAQTNTANNCIIAPVAGGLPLAGSHNFTGETDPRLAPLAYYGGPTFSRPPLPGSPVIDGAILQATTPLRDQLGNVRPSGQNPDIGAVEAVALGMYWDGLVDSEPDGIPDLWEGPEGPYPHLNPGVDDSTVDTDGDGSPDVEELGNMTDLYDPNDVFRILSIRPAPGFDPTLNPLFEITVKTFPGLNYRFDTGTVLPGLDPKLGSGFTADDFTTTVELLLSPDRDFVQAVRE